MRNRRASSASRPPWWPMSSTDPSDTIDTRWEPPADSGSSTPTRRRSPPAPADRIDEQEPPIHVNPSLPQEHLVGVLQAGRLHGREVEPGHGGHGHMET